MSDNRKKSTDPIIAQKSGKFIMEYNRIFENITKNKLVLSDKGSYYNRE